MLEDFAETLMLQPLSASWACSNERMRLPALPAHGAVEDEAFWAGLEPLRFGQLPRLQDSVTVIGYPVGGDTMSVTSGVVSRIEVGMAGVLLHTVMPQFVPHAQDKLLCERL